MNQFVCVKTGIRALLLGALVLLLSSCFGKGSGPEQPSYPNGIVTVKTHPETKQVFLQLDERTTLLPVNLKQHPFKGKQVRALVSYEEDAKAAHEGYTKAVRVNWIDSILTKPTVPNLADNIKAYGGDPLDVRKEDMLIEDGYLTLVFYAHFGVRGGKPHRINLVHGSNPHDPYELLLCHDAQGDIAHQPGMSGNFVGRGWVAFDLSQLPDTKGEKVQMTIRFRSYGSEKLIRLDYTTGKTTPPLKQPEKEKKHDTRALLDLE